MDPVQQQQMEQLGLGVGIGSMVLWVAIALLMIVSMWKCFEKAGQAGWASIVPFYNLIVLLKIAGRPAWWLILFLIPLVNIVVLFITYIDFARSYGKGTGFGIGLIFLGFVFFPMLAFGDARYVGPAAKTLQPAAA